MNCLSSTIGRGTLAFYDGMRGLVPCKVDSVAESDHGLAIVAVATAAVYPYNKGDKIESDGRRIVPRSSILRRQYSTHILPYRWVIAEEPQA